MPTEEPVRTHWTVLNTLQWTCDYFKRNNLDNPRLDAEILLAHSLKCRHIDLYVRYDQPLNEDELAQFKQLIKRRLNREPVAYITGAKEFWSLEFQVDPAVLIPRPDTEILVETALKYIPIQEGASSCRVLELGVGSGAVAISLAHERKGCHFWASDRSRAAVHVARKNARSHGVGQRIHFFVGNWLDAVAPQAFRFDLIISNPPYIPSRAIGQLAPEIRCCEPAGALDGGPDGLREIGTIMAQAQAWLRPGGFLLLEIGFDQHEGVEALTKRFCGYESPFFQKDYAGYDRVVCLKKRSCENMLQTNV